MSNILVGAKVYDVLHDGRIVKRRGKGFVKQWPDKDGYLRYHIRNEGITYNFYVHRLVWEYHNGSIPDGMTVDHIDGDKINNDISNLQLLTPEENAAKGNRKVWFLTSPEGALYLIRDMEIFCALRNLHAGHMREVANGNLKQHKGWIK